MKVFAASGSATWSVFFRSSFFSPAPFLSWSDGFFSVRYRSSSNHCEQSAKAIQVARYRAQASNSIKFCTVNRDTYLRIYFRYHGNIVTVTNLLIETSSICAPSNILYFPGIASSDAVIFTSIELGTPRSNWKESDTFEVTSKKL